MKNDIKKLYRKDPKLAIQVAKALSMKIVAKKRTLSDYRASLTNIDTKTEQLIKDMAELEKYIKKFPAMLKLLRTVDSEVIRLKSEINADIE